MHLVSRRDQVVYVSGVPFFFAKGESIHTENSYKYSLPALTDLAEVGGFAVERVWMDERQYFSVAYLALRHSGKDVCFLCEVAAVRRCRSPKPWPWPFE